MCQHLRYQSYGLYLETGICRHVSASGKVPTPGKVPTCAGTCWHIQVPTCANTYDTNYMVFIWMLECVHIDMCQHLKRCRHLGRCWHVPTNLGADTCRNLWYQSYGLYLNAECVDMCPHLKRCPHMLTLVILIIWTFYLEDGMCWHVSAPWKVPTPGKLLTRADTSRCRHMPTSVLPIIWTLFGCWNVLTCISTWKSANTREGTGTCWHV